VAGFSKVDSSLFTNTIQNQDTGVLLTITPRINSSGLVICKFKRGQLALAAHRASVAEHPEAKHLDAGVVQTEETSALGGSFRRAARSPETESRCWETFPTWGCSSYHVLQHAATELIILLTPTVIPVFSEAQGATDELRNKLGDLARSR